jgi:hypothetical protein
MVAQAPGMLLPMGSARAIADEVLCAKICF